jgi:glucose-6-phosphate 1-dehydrogenase
MNTAKKPDPVIITIFGGGGDLTWRKLIPALYDIFREDWLPDQFRIVCVDIGKYSNTSFLDHL